MSLVESYHAAHKARLLRLGAPSPYQATYSPPPAPAEPPPEYPKFNIQTLYYHQMWFFDLITERQATSAAPPKVEHVIQATAEYFTISKNDLLSARRTADIARPRQIAMYLAKKLSLKSLPEIGRRLGGRDHTTILHGVRRIEDLLPHDENLRRDVATIKASLR